MSLRVADFMAYYRRVKADFLAAADEARVGPPAYPPEATYPDPVEHCEICRWWAVCRDRRRADDDLSLVAGISGRQRRGLKGRSADDLPGPIATRRGLARAHLPLRPRLEGSTDAALERVREQARIQVEGEDRGETLWELLEPEWAEDRKTGERALVPDRGFLVLPKPSPNDLFLDLEGDPFAFDDGIDYLFGILDPAAGEDDPRWASAPGADAESASGAGGEGPAGGASVARVIDAGPTAAHPADAELPKFHAFWSLDDSGRVSAAAEKAAFERTIDFLIARLEADPTLHVYHYAAYEKTALGRLAQRHATREEEVDRLLKGRVLVDLYRVVRQGIRASVESYSIKRLEPLYGLVREVQLRDAGSSIVQFETWLGRGATPEGLVGDAILREIEGYNRDDVVSTWRLREWLEARRPDLGERLGMDPPRPPLRPEASEPDEPAGRAAEVAAVVEALEHGLTGVEPDTRTAEQNAAWLLAQLLGWHRRENKAFWWRYYDLCGKTDADLVEEREPLGMVELEADLGQVSRSGAHLQRFRFPLQDHAVKIGRQVDDPRTEKSAGKVAAIDEIGGTVTLYRTAGELARGVPASLLPNEFVRTAVIEDSLLRIGRWVAGQGAAAGIAGQAPAAAGIASQTPAAAGIAGQAPAAAGIASQAPAAAGIASQAPAAAGIASPAAPYRAARELLLRRPPQIAGALPGSSLRAPGETALEAATRLALALDGGVLAIQGPPGTGKTWTGARMILALVAAGRTVGVTANSHKVIGHVLDAVHDAAVASGTRVAIGQKPGEDEEPTCPHAEALRQPADIAAALATRRLQVGRRHGVAVVRPRDGGERRRPPRRRGRAIQPRQHGGRLRGRSLPRPAGRSAAAGPAPQGEPPSRRGAERPRPPPRRRPGRTPGDDAARSWASSSSARGGSTRTSAPTPAEVFYDGRLLPEPGRERQALAGSGAARRRRGFAGSRSSTPATTSTARRRRWRSAACWRSSSSPPWQPVDGRQGVTRRLLQEDVRDRRAVQRPRGPDRSDARRGRARRRAASAPSTSSRASRRRCRSTRWASSSPEDAPRGMEFLYSLNRLNVATSRARCVAAVVASPALVRVALPDAAPDAPRQRAVPPRGGRAGLTRTVRDQPGRRMQRIDHRPSRSWWAPSTLPARRSWPRAEGGRAGFSPSSRRTAPSALAWVGVICRPGSPHARRWRRSLRRARSSSV